MASKEMHELANRVLNSERLQGEIQRHLDHLAFSIVKTAKENGCEFTVEEGAEFFSEAMFQNSTPPADQWGQLLFKMLKMIKVVDANAQIFKTMALDGLEGALPPGVQEAIDAAKARRNN